eukprot:CFRG6029T1
MTVNQVCRETANIKEIKNKRKVYPSPTLAQYVTTIYFYLTLVGVHLVFGILLTPWFFIIDNPEMLRRGLFMSHTVMRFVQWPILRIDFENVPKNPTNYVIYCNHVTAWDCFWVDRANNPNMSVIVAQFVMDIPLFGAWVRKMGGIPIAFSKPTIQESTETVKSSARECASMTDEWLKKDNFCLGVFPEGVRSKTGELKDFKPLTFKLAIRYKKGVYPSVMLGADKIHPVGQQWMSPGKVVIKYGDMISTEGLTESNEDIEKLMDQVRFFMQTNLDEYNSKLK